MGGRLPPDRGVSVGPVEVEGPRHDHFLEPVIAEDGPLRMMEAAEYELRENLAPHKTPKQWFAVEEFPLTGSGKIQKYKLRDQWEAGEWSEL